MCACQDVFNCNVLVLTHSLPSQDRTPTLTCRAHHDGEGGARCGVGGGCFGGGSFDGDSTGGKRGLTRREGSGGRPYDPSHRRTTHEIRARQHPVVVRNVGGVTEGVEVLVVATVVAVVSAAKAEPRGPFAEWLDAKEEVGDTKTVDAIVPGAGVGRHRAQPRVADVAHVVLVVEVEAGDGELDALGGGKVDSEAVRAAVAVERATAAEDVVGGGEETEEGGAEVAADEADEALPAGLAERSADATVLDTLEKGVEALDGTAASKRTVSEQVVVGGDVATTAITTTAAATSSSTTAAATATTATAVSTAISIGVVVACVVVDVVAFGITVVDDDWLRFRRRLTGYRIRWNVTRSDH